MSMSKHFRLLIALCMLAAPTQGLKNAIRGKKCTQNQVVNKLTVYEDGAIEAECGPMPCGSTDVCAEDMSSCRAPSEVFSGMKWAKNGQSLLLRCCAMQAGNKVYIGTDLVTLGSYYTGGIVPEKDMIGSSGVEYDFVANARTEQGGVRVWVYRLVCAGQQQGNAAQTKKQSHQTKQQEQQQQTVVPNHAPNDDSTVGADEEQPKFSEVQDGQAESHNLEQQQQQTMVAATQMDEQPAVQNPLQYRPQKNRQQKE